MPGFHAPCFRSHAASCALPEDDRKGIFVGPLEREKSDGSGLKTFEGLLVFDHTSQQSLGGVCKKTLGILTRPETSQHWGLLSPECWPTLLSVKGIFTRSSCLISPAHSTTFVLYSSLPPTAHAYDHLDIFEPGPSVKRSL